MQKIALEDATLEQAKHFATTNLGITVKHNTGLVKIVSKIKEAQEGITHIEVPDELAEQAAAGSINGNDDDTPPAALGAAAPASNETTSNEVAAAQKPQEQPKPKPAESNMEEKVKILIPATETDSEAVFVSVNGVGMHIPRGKECEVKRKYVECLKNAVQTKYKQDPKTGEMREYEAPLYPFSLV